jgi:hypothetical protein
MDLDHALMNTEITQAREKWDEYRAIKNPSEAEDLARRAFRQMAFGRQVIDLNLAIGGAGLGANGLPLFAIARAHWSFVHAWWSDSSRVHFTRRPQLWGRSGLAQQRRNPSVPLAATRPRLTGRAQVPSIPPGIRAELRATQDKPSAHFILFEAVWEEIPPTDPVLLSHLGGPFYVVRAHWDLTPLERGLLRELL